MRKKIDNRSGYSNRSSESGEGNEAQLEDVHFAAERGAG